MTDLTGIRNTCPSIDGAITEIREAADWAQYLEAEADSRRQSFLHMIDLMEELRSDNEKLRSLALEKIEEVSDKDDEITDLEIKVRTLEDEMEGLREDKDREISDLESQIQSLEDEVEEFNNDR